MKIKCLVVGENLACYEDFEEPMLVGEDRKPDYDYVAVTFLPFGEKSGGRFTVKYEEIDPDIPKLGDVVEVEVG